MATHCTRRPRRPSGPLAAFLITIVFFVPIGLSSLSAVAQSPVECLPGQSPDPTTGLCPPTPAPTDVPTLPPTLVPTDVPTDIPTMAPTSVPTDVLTIAPTSTPTEPLRATATMTPTPSPTATPTATDGPTAVPTISAPTPPPPPPPPIVILPWPPAPTLSPYVVEPQGPVLTYQLGTIYVHSFGCPPGFDAASASLSDLVHMCRWSQNTAIAVTSGGNLLASLTTQMVAEGTSEGVFDKMPTGVPLTLTETVPAEHGTPVVWCSGVKMTASGAGSIDLMIPPPPNASQNCTWYNVPDSEFQGLTYDFEVQTFGCPTGFDAAKADMQALETTCTTPLSGVPVTVMLDGSMIASGSTQLEYATARIDFPGLPEATPLTLTGSMPWPFYTVPVAACTTQLAQVNTDGSVTFSMAYDTDPHGKSCQLFAEPIQWTVPQAFPWWFTP